MKRENMGDMQDNLTGKKAEQSHTDARTQAERTAIMRRRLLEAAIACLCRVGYASTTTQLVTEEAGVSRGAMLHHFPTKMDLVIAVAEYAAESNNRVVRRTLAKLSPGMDRFMALTTATWEAMCLPPALALIEILVASRSDDVLKEKFPPVLQSLEMQQLKDVCALANEIGMRDLDGVARMVQLHRTAMRGLVLDIAFSGDWDGAKKAIELLCWYKRQLTGELLTSPANSTMPWIGSAGDKPLSTPEWL